MVFNKGFFFKYSTILRAYLSPFAIASKFCRKKVASKFPSLSRRCCCIASPDLHFCGLSQKLRVSGGGLCSQVRSKRKCLNETDAPSELEKFRGFLSVKVFYFLPLFATLQVPIQTVLSFIFVKQRRKKQSSKSFHCFFFHNEFSNS